MTKILTILLTVLTLNATAQNISLVGKVHPSSMNKTSKVYYTQNGKKFNKSQFIKYDKEGNYNFKISINKIKKEAINYIAFSESTSNSADEEHACVQRIHVGKIIQAKEFEKLKNINLRTDLMLNLNCSLTTVESAEDNGKGRFVGKYQFTSNDTIRHLDLWDRNFRCQSTLPKKTKEYINEEFGYWDYDKDLQVLRISIRRQMNKDYGLRVSTKIKFEFKVKENGKEINFIQINGNGAIKKL